MPRPRARAAASWFPGHMAAGLREVLAVASLIDLVIEVRDARVPLSTAVAHLHTALRTKPKVVLLNRQDLADARCTTQWVNHLRAGKLAALAGTGTRAATLRPLRAMLLERVRFGGRQRIAVIGAPNTGKSSVINALVQRKRTTTENRPGVTRSARWIALESHVDLLDTPGVLAPAIHDETTAWRLALCGILPETAFDIEEAVERLGAPDAPAGSENLPTLESFARSRGMLRRGGELDRRNAARAYLAAFRAGKFGRITLELPETGV